MSAMPIIPDTNEGPRLLIPCGIFGFIALTLNIARIYSRLVSSHRLKLDDYLISIAGVLSLAGYITSCIAVHAGWGHISYYVTLSQIQSALKCQVAIQLFWILTIALIRTSISISLLRFSDAIWWRMILYTIIVVVCLLPVGSLVFLFGSTQPFHAFWDLSPAKYWDVNIQIIYGWICAGLFILFDLLLALMPMKILSKLDRPRNERILIGFLMAMGLFATAIAAVKMTTFKNLGKGDALSATVYSSMLAKVEEQVGIIAACLPCLKSTGERILRQLGIISARIAHTISSTTAGRTTTAGTTTHTGTATSRFTSQALSSTDDQSTSHIQSQGESFVRRMSSNDETDWTSKGRNPHIEHINDQSESSKALSSNEKHGYNSSAWRSV